MTYTRYHRAAAVTACLALFVSACGSDGEHGEANDSADQSSTAESTERTTLKLGLIPGSPAPVAVHVAAEQGYFDKYGLDVEVVGHASAAEMLASSVHGDVEIFMMGAPVAFSGYAAGECTSALPIASQNMNNIIAQPDIVAETGPDDIESLQVLKGRSVGVSALGASGEEFARTLLEAAGLDPSHDVSFVATGGGGATAIAAFEERGVDAMLSFPPVEATLGKGNYSMLYQGVGNDESPLADVVSTYYAARCDWVADNESTAIAFCSALWDASELLQSDEGEEVATRAIARELALDEDVATAAWADLKGAIPADPAWDKATWQAQVKFVPPSVSVDAVPPADEVLFEPCTSDPR